MVHGMEWTTWLTMIGVLLILAAVTQSFVQRLALTMPILYLAVGFALGPSGYGLQSLDPLQDAGMVERFAEFAVIIALFTAGLKVGFPLRSGYWAVPLRLAFGSMALTVALVAVIGVWVLGLSPGAAVLLGAILAPTDPVLASDVQLVDARDWDRLRVGMTGEAGLNDGTAFPFVMLGLGLLGLHEIGAFGWRWVMVDLVWGIVGGVGVGAALGYGVGRFILYLRVHRKEAAGRDEFLALGLIAVAYGLAIMLHSYGFLAVFAAGVALRQSERQPVLGTTRVYPEASGDSAKENDPTPPRPEVAPVGAAQEMLRFNEQAEHIGEFIVVLLVGAMLSRDHVTPFVLLFIAVLFVLIRPLAVWLGLLGSATPYPARGLMAWSGIRGIGSLYYLAYAIGQGLAPELAEQLTAITLAVIAASIFVHGLTVPYLMGLYIRTRADR